MAYKFDKIDKDIQSKKKKKKSIIKKAEGKNYVRG